MTEMFYRFRSMADAEKPADDGQIRLLASTDDAVDWGGWREILSHKDGAVDYSAARSLLINHKPDQLAGKISGMAVDGRQMTSNAKISPDARMQSGVGVAAAVADGSLRGVSIGYAYNMADTTFSEETRTLFVNKWRCLEISLTPIPADGKAQVRSMPEGMPEVIRDVPPQPIISHSTIVAPATGKESRVSDDTNKPNSPGQEAANITNQTAISEKVRADTIKDAREIAALAVEHKLDASKYIGMSRDAASGAMLKDLAERNKSDGDIGHPAPAISRMNYDAVDKAADAVAGAIALNAGFRDAKIQAGNPLAGKGIQGIVKGFANMAGEDTRNWEKNEVAMYALGKIGHTQAGSRSAANVTSSMFSTWVMLNAIKKTTAMGYERGSAASRYQRIVSTNTVPDFKTFYIGALGAGNFTNTPEDIALPELTKSEGVYSSTAKTWGGTVSLTLQAYVNDDTSAFSRIISQAGGLLDKTKDRRTFQKLLMGTSSSEGTSTWTSNTTSGGTLVYTTQDTMAAARGKLGLVRTALQIKAGLDGNPLGTIARFLLCGPTREMEAQGLCGASGPGLQAGVQNPASSMEVISSAWLEATALTGYSTTSYYLLADPNEVTGLVLTGVQGYEGVQVEPYDAGAVLAQKWKLWSPFEVDLHYLSVNGTNTVAAAQQGTT